MNAAEKHYRNNTKLAIKLRENAGTGLVRMMTIKFTRKSKFIEKTISGTHEGIVYCLYTGS